MMKKISIILVMLFWCNVSFAKEIWVKCSFDPGKGHSGFVRTFIIDETNQTLIMSGVEKFVIEFNDRFIRFKDKAEQKDLWAKTLDRISGIYDNKYSCKVVRKTAF